MIPRNKPKTKLDRRMRMRGIQDLVDSLYAECNRSCPTQPNCSRCKNLLNLNPILGNTKHQFSSGRKKKTEKEPTEKRRTRTNNSGDKNTKRYQLPTTRENRNQENRINQPVHEKAERWILSSPSSPPNLITPRISSSSPSPPQNPNAAFLKLPPKPRFTTTTNNNNNSDRRTDRQNGRTDPPQA